MPRLKSLRVLWEPRDLWIGVFIRPDGWGVIREWTIYVCLLPCLPIRMVWRNG
jgi:hypothetical protein